MVRTTKSGEEGTKGNMQQIPQNSGASNHRRGRPDAQARGQLPDPSPHNTLQNALANSAITRFMKDYKAAMAQGTRRKYFRRCDCLIATSSFHI